MCALDALGVASMLGRTVEIASTCVHCGAPITSTVTPEHLKAWSPPEPMITARCGSEVAHTTRCPAMRFAYSVEHAQSWIGEHGAAGDLVLAVEPAVEIAQQRFATCYTAGRCEHPLADAPAPSNGWCRS
jgi:hypothetical protein